MDAAETHSVARPRITLKQMFAVLTAVALVLAPAHWFKGEYIVSACFSIGLVMACVGIYRKWKPGALIFALAAAFFGLVFAIVLLVFFFHTVLTLFACVVLCAIRVPTRVFAAALVAVMVAVYGYAFTQGAMAARDIQMLKAMYPFKSLRDRLVFEEKKPAGNVSPAQPIQLSNAVATTLFEQDKLEESHFYSRSGALRDLHEASYHEFARAAGFGFMRMDSLRYRLAERRDEQFHFQLPAEITMPKSNDASQSLSKAHAIATNDFISPDSMGYARNRDEVAGFDSHRFRSLDRDWDQSYRADGKQDQWSVTRLELVSLLRHDEPRVYTALTMPAMDKLAGVPTRPLNSFEQTALPQLATQQDVVINQQPEEIEMLGALRAGTKCLECHQGDRGKLLGAFSYTLIPLTATTKANRAAEPAAN